MTFWKCHFTIETTHNYCLLLYPVLCVSFRLCYHCMYHHYNCQSPGNLTTICTSCSLWSFKVHSCSTLETNIFSCPETFISVQTGVTVKTLRFCYRSFTYLLQLKLSAINQHFLDSLLSCCVEVTLYAYIAFFRFTFFYSIGSAEFDKMGLCKSVTIVICLLSVTVAILVVICGLLSRVQF